MKQKGFTLIELLAVIVILAIIALIATPIVLNIIKDAKESSAIRSGEFYIDAIEQTIASKRMKNKKIIDNTYTVENLKSNGVSVSGELPEGTVTIENNKIVSCVLTFDKTTLYCDGDKLVLAPPVGTTIYFNPKDNTKCTETTYATELDNYKKANSLTTPTGQKEGCMKWYVISTNGNDVNMILDHNTTAKLQWNSSGNNASGPNEIMTSLANDTSSWSIPNRTDSYTVNKTVGGVTQNYTIDYSNYKARLITADEIAHIVGSDRDDTIKWKSTNAYGTTIANQSTWFFFDGGRNSDPTSYNKWQRPYATSKGMSNYAWLYDYTKNCENSGCNYNDSSNQGYWTSSVISSFTGFSWIVDCGGVLADFGVEVATTYGLRPVITISNSSL